MTSKVVPNSTCGIFGIARNCKYNSDFSISSTNNIITDIILINFSSCPRSSFNCTNPSIILSVHQVQEPEQKEMNNGKRLFYWHYLYQKMRLRWLEKQKIIWFKVHALKIWLHIRLRNLKAGNCFECKVKSKTTRTIWYWLEKRDLCNTFQMFQIVVVYKIWLKNNNDEKKITTFNDKKQIEWIKRTQIH